MNTIILLTIASLSQYGSLIGDPAPKQPPDPSQAFPSQPILDHTIEDVIKFPTVELPPDIKTKSESEKIREIFHEILQEIKKLGVQRQDRNVRKISTKTCPDDCNCSHGSQGLQMSFTRDGNGQDWVQDANGVWFHVVDPKSIGQYIQRQGIGSQTYANTPNNYTQPTLYGYTGQVYYAPANGMTAAWYAPAYSLPAYSLPQYGYVQNGYRGGFLSGGRFLSGGGFTSCLINGTCK